MWQYFFEIPVQNHENNEFLVPNLRIFIFAVFKLDEVDLKTLKFLFLVFLVPHLCIYIVVQTFAITKLRGDWFQLCQTLSIMTSFF